MAGKQPTCPKEEGSGAPTHWVVVPSVVLGAIFGIWFIYIFCLRLGNIAEYNKFGQEREDPSMQNGTGNNPDALPLPSGTWTCTYRRNVYCCCKQNMAAKLSLEFQADGSVSGRCEDADGEHMMRGSYNLRMETVRLAILYRWGSIEMNTNFLGEADRADEVVLEGYYVTLVGTEGKVKIKFDPMPGQELPKKPMKRPSRIDAALGAAAEKVLKKSGSQESIARLSQRRSSRGGSSASLGSRTSRTSRTSLNSRMSITEWIFKAQDDMIAKGEKRAKKKEQREKAEQAKAEQKNTGEESQVTQGTEEAPSEKRSPYASEPESLKLDVWEEAPGEAYQKPLGSKSAHPSKSVHPMTLPPIREQDLPTTHDSKNVGPMYKVVVHKAMPIGAIHDELNDGTDIAVLDREESSVSKGICKSLLCLPEVRRENSGGMPP